MILKKKNLEINVLIFILLFYTIAQIFSVKYNLRMIIIGFTMITFAYLIWNRITNRITININKVDIILIVYICLIIIYFLLQKNREVAMKGLLAHAKFIIFYLIGKLTIVKLTKENMNKLIRLMILIGIVTGIYGIYQYYFDYYTLGKALSSYDLLFKNYGGTPSRPRQMYSFFLNPLTTAYMLGISIISLYFVIIHSIKNTVINTKTMIIYVSSMIILIFALIITYNRTTPLAILFAFAIVIFTKTFRKDSLIELNIRKFVAKNKSISIAVSVVGLILIIYILSKTNLSYFFSIFHFGDKYKTAGHYEYIAKGIKFLIKYPLGLGLGVSTKMGNLIYPKLNTWNESFYFFISTEIGALGLVLYLAFLSLIYINIVKLYKIYDNKDFKKFLLITITILLNLTISNIFLPIFISWIPTNFIFVYLGMIINYEKNIERGPSIID